MTMKLKLKDIMKYYQNGSHDIAHILRVYKNALKIAESEDCDIEVIKAAALLHDIARSIDENNTEFCHAEEGTKMAEAILKNFDYSQEQKENIIHSIRVHSYSGNHKTMTTEAKILQDADRLDALGAIAIARVFYYEGRFKGIIHDPKIKPNTELNSKPKTAINVFYEKILKLSPDSFHTSRGKQLAEERYEFIKKFLKQFIKEWNGEI
jgi:uncharacterized protein